MSLITNIAYSPDPAAGQAVVFLDWPSTAPLPLRRRLGDGTPLQSYTIDPGSRIVHLSHGYDGPAGLRHHRHPRQGAGLPDERSTLALQVAAEPHPI